MSVVKGKDVWLYVLDSDNVLKPIACLRTCTLTTTADKSETSTLESGVWKTYRYDRLGWSVTAEGLQSFDTNIPVAKIRNLQFSFSVIFISFIGTDDNGITENYTGNVLIDSVDSSASYNDIYNYSIQCTGSGELTITDAPFDPNELIGGIMIYNYDGTGTETDGNLLPPITALAGMDIKAIERDGLYYRYVASNPTGKAFTLDPLDPTRIKFADDLPPIQPGEMIDIIYQNP